MTAVFLAAWLAGACAAETAPASTEDVKLVEAFLKTPTAELPPAAVDHFVAIEPEALPKKLRQRYKAKRLELYTLRQLAQGKKKGTLRTPEDGCQIPREAKSGE